MSGGIHRADLALIGTAAAATGLSNSLNTASAIANEAVTVDQAVRWFEVAVVLFPYQNSLAYLTPTDLIAVISAAILLIRFAAWASVGTDGRWPGGFALIPGREWMANAVLKYQ